MPQNNENKGDVTCPDCRYSSAGCCLTHFNKPSPNQPKGKCESSDILLLSNPPQHRCKKCGKTWRTTQVAPDCDIKLDVDQSEECKKPNAPHLSEGVRQSLEESYRVQLGSTSMIGDIASGINNLEISSEKWELNIAAVLQKYLVTQLEWRSRGIGYDFDSETEIINQIRTLLTTERKKIADMLYKEADAVRTWALNPNKLNHLEYEVWRNIINLADRISKL